MATFQCRVQYLDDTDPFNSTNFPEPTRPPTYTFLRNVPLANQIAGVKRLLKAPHKLEDCSLQLYKYNGAQGDYGTYLDLESNLDEQSDDLEGFGEIRKNAIILRTQLSVRVHACIEKLLNSSGRELRRALFSLKQIFQDDKDLVHEFVNHDGLECLIKVGSEADQNYQNYILRALGQVMLYVDGMNGVIAHNETIQWLYSLVASRFRLVVKTALKLLLVFIEYTECNTLLLIQAVEMVDQQQVTKPWSKMMDILTEKDGGDTELLVYTMTLINKALNATHDQDTFYDLVDALEEQGIARLIRDGLSRPGQDADLVEQYQLYEAVLRQEDREGGASPVSVRKMPRVKSDEEQRKSRRYSTGSIHNPPATSPGVGRRGGADRRGALPPTSEAAEIHELQSDVEPSTTRFSKLPPTSPSNRLAPPGPARRPPTESPGWGGNVRPSNEISLTSSTSTTRPRSTQRRRRRERQCVLIEEQENIAKENNNNNLSAENSSISDRTNIVLSDNVVDGQDAITSRLCQIAEVSSDVDTISSHLNDDAPSVTDDTSLTHNDDAVRTLPPTDETSTIPGQTRRCRERLKADGDDISLVSNASTLSSASTLTTDSGTASSTLTHDDTGTDISVALTPDADTKRQSMSSLSDLENLDDQGLEPQHQPCTQRRRRITRESDESGLHHPSNESGYLSTTDPAMAAESADIIPPAGVSNNRRWMLYKINKQNQDAAAAEAAAAEAALRSPPAVTPEFDNQGAVQSAADKLQSTATEVETPSTKPSTAEFDNSLSGMLNKARQGLSQASGAPSDRVSASEAVVTPAAAKSDSDLRWEDLERSMCRPLRINDMDFSDLKDFDDINLLEAQTIQMPHMPAQSGYRAGGKHAPPPPPPPGMPPPPPGPPPAPFLGAPPPAPNHLSPNKSRRTVKLHWREARFDYSTLSGRRVDTIWSKLERDVGRVEIDSAQLEHLFESRSTDIKPKKSEATKKEISVLGAKRSNAINIGLTVLPPPRTIKSAILKMDNSIMNREGIEKLLTTMLPTDEEKSSILEAQMSHPDVPLGSAEQFLLTLSSVSEIHARLALWAFRLDYDGTESEIAEPLMDLKQGIESLQYNKTFKFILALLLQIGNFLNNQPAKGFNVEYLSKVPEVKDTVHKHSLLYHLCNMLVDKFPRSTDLYSEIGAIARVSKVDFTELAEKLEKLENDCKSSWDHLRAIAKHDSSSVMRTKLSEFLSDCAERIIVLKIVHKRMRNRFNKFLLFLGYPSHLAVEVRINVFCKIVSEFALEYRTTREKVLQQREKKANQRERRKTRGKMITETEKFAGRPSSQMSESRSENALSNLLHNGYSTDQEKSTHMSLPGARIRKRLSVDQGQKTGRRSLAPPRGTGGTDSESVYDTADDEMLDAVLKTATASPLSRVPRDRKRARNRDRKSLRRTLKTGLTPDEVASVSRRY